MSCNYENLSYTSDKEVIQSIINNWSKLSKGEQLKDTDFNLFIKFISLWVTFNAIYELTCSSVRGDRYKVRAFSKLIEAQAMHIELMSDLSYKQAVGILAEQGILKLPNRSSRQEISDINNLEEVMLCVYQVRCNLFHGGKTPENPRDTEVVEAAYRIVGTLIEPFIQKINEV
jgi:hypothetical protein